MKKKIPLKNSGWTFSGTVAKSFDNHIKRSVPYYNEMHEVGLAVSDFFVTNNARVLDIGCSTGTFLNKVKKKLGFKKLDLVGIDIEKKMIEFAKKNSNGIKFSQKDYLKTKFKKQNLITSFFTAQFISSSKRQIFFNKVYKDLLYGGGFLLFEKVRGNDARFNEIMNILYDEFKSEQGFTAKQILDKTRSLKGVMEPFSSRANYQLLKNAGFKDFMTIFKYLNFQGFLAIK